MKFKLLIALFLIISISQVNANAYAVYNGVTDGWVSHEVLTIFNVDGISGVGFGSWVDVEFESDTKILHIIVKNSNNIEYIYWNGTQFERELAVQYDNFGLGSRDIYLELDPDRNPTIFFKDDFITNEIVMVKRINGIWQTSYIGGKKVQLGIGYGLHNFGNIRIAPNGNIVNLSFVGCPTFCDKKMVFFEYDGTTWTEEIVEDITPYNYGFSPPRVAFDSAGNPQVVYRVNESPSGCAQLNWRYAKRIDGVWNVERINVASLINCRENIKGSPYVMDGDEKEVFTFGWGEPYTRIYKQGTEWIAQGPTYGDRVAPQNPIKLANGGYAYAKTQVERYYGGPVDTLVGDTFLSLYNEDEGGFKGKIENYYYTRFPPIVGTGTTMTFMADDGQFVVAYVLEGAFKIATNGPLAAPLTPNNPPIFDPIGDKQGIAGEKLEFIVNATDLEGGPLTYDSANLPDGASFNPITKTFTWIPRTDQTGSYLGVEFKVSDNKDTSSEFITITVLMKPTANFTAIPRIGVTPLIVDFDASNSIDDTVITDYDWDFGDGSYGTGINQQNLYSTIDPVDASLTVTDEHGLSDTVTKQVVPYGFESITDLEFSGHSTNNPILVRVKCTKDIETNIEMWKVDGASPIALIESITIICNDSDYAEIVGISEPGSYQIIAKLNLVEDKCSRCEIKQFLTIAKDFNINVSDSNTSLAIITLLIVLGIVSINSKNKKKESS